MMAITRRLFIFLLLGGVALALTRFLAPAPQLSVPESVLRAPVYEQDQWILLDQAHRLGWATSDPVSAQHLIRGMRDIGEDGSARELLDKAVALELQRHDPVVQARLLDRARRALRRIPDDRLPSRETLVDYVRENPQLFAREGEFRFAQVFFEDSPGAQERANRLHLALRKGEIEPAALLAQGDPLLGLRPVQTASPGRLEAKFGKEYRTILEACSVDSFCGPARSVFGLHYLYVLARKEPGVPPFPQIEEQVRKAYLQHLEAQLEKERMGHLRQRYGL